MQGFFFVTQTWDRDVIKIIYLCLFMVCGWSWRIHLYIWDCCMLYQADKSQICCLLDNFSIFDCSTMMEVSWVNDMIIWVNRKNYKCRDSSQINVDAVFYNSKPSNSVVKIMIPEVENWTYFCSHYLHTTSSKENIIYWVDHELPSRWTWRNLYKLASSVKMLCYLHRYLSSL